MGGGANDFHDLGKGPAELLAELSDQMVLPLPLFLSLLSLVSGKKRFKKSKEEGKLPPSFY